MPRPFRRPDRMIRFGVTTLVGVALLLLLVACGSAADEEPAAPLPPQPPPPAAARPTPASAPTGGTVTIKFIAGTQAIYRVREQIAGRNVPSDAVGGTLAVEGAIVFNADGTVDAEQSRITVDVSTLRSDEGRRDSYIRGNSLQSRRFPNVVIAVRDVQGLPWPLPTSGEATFQIVGDMTIRDETRLVTWDATANFSDGSVEGVAKTEVTFEQFKMSKPRLAFILSVADEIRLEIGFIATISGD